MIKPIQFILDQVILRKNLVEKQRLYAQMLKDNMKGHPILDKLSSEIEQLNIRLHGKTV